VAHSPPLDQRFVPLPDPLTFAVVAAGIALIAFMKGAFGGGFAIIGIPLLSLVLDPLTAGVLLAPMFLVMDVFAFRYWKPSTWSKPDIVLLGPAAVIGIIAGYFLLRVLSPAVVKIVMALITLGFTAIWFTGGARPEAEPRRTSKALLCGTAAGVTSMIAHAGGPPLAMYLLPLGLPKEILAGTTSLFFTIANVVKTGPWLMLQPPGKETLAMMALTIPVIPVGVWAGWRMHSRLNQMQMYRACYGLLTVVAVKLLWDGIRAL
jgi:uncharacterized protein